MSTLKPIKKSKEEMAETVRKLLAQAEDPAVTAEEAQSFSMKAQQLMTKYSIELIMVADAVDTGQLTQDGWTIEGPYANHKVTLVSAVARANDCRAIYTELAAGRRYIQVLGYPGDVEWVRTLSRSLEIQMAAALAVAVRARPPRVHGRTYAVGFIQGFIAEVSSRLHQARKAGMAAAESARAEEHGQADPHASAASPGQGGGEQDGSASSVALVLVAKRQRVEEEFSVRFPGSRSVHSQVRLQSWSGYGPGRDAGRRASIARGSVAGGSRRLSA